MAARPEHARRLLLFWMDVVIGFLCLMFLLVVFVHAVNERISPLSAALTIVCLAGVCGLFPFLMRDAYDVPRKPTPKLFLAGLLAAGAIALLPDRPLTGTTTWMEVGILWLAVAALYLPLAATICLGTAVVGLVAAYAGLVTEQPWQGVLLTQVPSAVVVTGGMLVWRWVWWSIRDAHDGKEAKATLAVSEERLRFARDLHDLLGHSLSVITLKSELAAKLASKDPERAASEMAQARRLIADALSEVQQAVHGYRALDLDEELSGVRATLEAAGTRCVIDARAGGLSPAARVLLAWAVREGATNVLKHSRATHCAITIDGGVLEMRNDGLDGQPSGHGNGLRGLSERLVAAGGSFSAGRTTTDEFLLRAAVPA
ncbi:sensor histidine kinase [Nonomuraea purpurea]|uniref:Sensor histidine kinase n=1 Tax=Nonomuraea purpurea TaxID=1849276 RepID=A0ABV8GBC7_9ACTN